MSNTPIVPLGYSSISGLVVSNNTTTPHSKLDVSAGSCLASDGVNYITLLSGVTINALTNGVLGLDTGTFTASTWYTIYVIGSSNNAMKPSVILSASTSPTLPFGYDIFRVCGYWYADTSTFFLLGKVSGNGNSRKHFHDTSISVLSGGTATTLTLVSIATAVPALDVTPVNIGVQFTPATANDHVGITTGTSTATVIPAVYGSVATKISSDNFQVLETLVSGVPNIKYINSAAAGATTILVSGFEYYL